MKKLLTVLFAGAIGISLSIPAMAQEPVRTEKAEHKAAKHRHHRHKKHHKQARKEERKEEKREHKG